MRVNFEQIEECLYFKYMSKEVDQNKLEGGEGGGQVGRKERSRGRYWGENLSITCAPQ